MEQIQQQIPASERESQLIAILNREPFLIVLDGLERILIAYSRMDANRIGDGEVENQSNVRRTADPRVGQFLKKLAHNQNSRILISTRLQPLEFENVGGDPKPGTLRLSVKGLTDKDAVALWRSFEITGSRDELLRVFNAFGKHPLLIQALAGEVKRYRKAPGDFDKWREANSQFDPSKFQALEEAMGYVLEFALLGLDEKAKKVSHTIAAFRMPAQYDTMSALLVGKGKPCANEHELDAILTELEDRGLIGWDKRANRYDLHPIVRAVVWSGLSKRAQRFIYTSLHSHFKALPIVENWLQVKTIEDLTPAVELFNALIGMERYEDACRVFCDRLDDATLYRLCAGRPRVELLEMLFRDGKGSLSHLDSPHWRAYALSSLALGYQLSGRPGKALLLDQLCNKISSERRDDLDLAIGLSNMANTMRLTGRLRESEWSACEALTLARKHNNHENESASLNEIGVTMLVRGNTNDSQTALHRALRIHKYYGQIQLEGFTASHLALHARLSCKPMDALSFANRAQKLAYFLQYENDIIDALQRMGEVDLELNKLSEAASQLHQALVRARAVNRIEKELQILVALAELQRRQGYEKAAREYLDNVWEYAERGPYPVHHVDALNVLVQIERDARNSRKAIEAATKAYQLAWCDGPPYAYHWGLIEAQKHLEELGAPLPEMPPFDESNYEPMPDVEINPKDEFHHGTNKQESNPTSKSQKKARGKRKKK
jgi:tetratricopeptide (TPR) repeat protein